MAVFRRRTRIVSFRLSDDEYESLKQVSLSEGARSVSDYARVALCRLLGASRPGDGDGIEAKVLHLDAQMQALQDELRRLQAVIGARPEAVARSGLTR
jgi:hypothetical protein